MNRRLLILVTVLFGALTAVALAQHGYWGILQPHLTSSAGLQVLADLVIALSFVMYWMVGDARRQGRFVWPWLLATLILGSFGPLFYLLARRRS